MNDSPNEPRYNEPAETETRQVVPSDWTYSEIEPQPEPPARRERLFPRKVLIGWALFAVAMYFGLRLVGTAVKESVRAAVSSAKGEAPRDKDIIYRSPNGKITISRPTPNGPIIISRVKPDVPAPPTPDAAAAPKAPTAVPAPNATPAPRAPPAKR